MFTVRPGAFRLYDFDDDVQFAINYEFNRDLSLIRRKVYGILDFLSDMGGLSGALKSLFALVILIFQWKAAINYVSNHTYYIRDGAEVSVRLSGLILTLLFIIRTQRKREIIRS